MRQSIGSMDVFGDITVGMRACIRVHVYTINYIVQTFGKINDGVNVYGGNDEIQY